MAVTNETGLSPQAPPQSQNPPAWYQTPQKLDGNLKQNDSSAASDANVSALQQKEGMDSKITQNESSLEKTDEMTDYMDDLTLSSPRERSRSGSRSSYSGRSCSRSSSRSSYSSRSSSSSLRSSRSWSRSRSHSTSHGKRNCSLKHRRYSRSYSRSRSRSRSYRYQERYHPKYYSRYCRTPPRYRSRSRSPRRSYYRRSYSRSRSRSRRYYGFGRTIYPEAYRSWRSRSRSRSRSRTPLRLTEKEKRELLEIAKANATKALGTQIVLPATLRIATQSKENESAKPKEESVSIRNKSSDTEEIMNMVSSTDEENVVKAVSLKPGSLPAKETGPCAGREELKNPAGQWIPVKEENVLFHNFSPRSISLRAR